MSERANRIEQESAFGKEHARVQIPKNASKLDLSC